VYQLLVHFIDDCKLYFLGANGEIWFSADLGATFTLATPPVIYDAIVAHPTVPEFLLGGDGVDCPDPFARETCYSLYFSSDAGVTWSLVHSLVLDFSWGLCSLQISTHYHQATFLRAPKVRTLSRCPFLFWLSKVE
jgi:hypothetical protein